MTPLTKAASYDEAKIRRQIITMATLQHELNTAVNPNWLASNNAWLRALQHEAIEMQDHIGWKWWKKQKPDIPQAQIELIDMWHFILSQYINTAYNDFKAKAAPGDIIFMAGCYEQTADMVVAAMHEPEEAMYNIMNRPFHPGALSPLDLLDVTAGLAGFGYVFPRGFVELMMRMSMNWDDVYRMYVGKNVLNTFRQANGYKEGTYIKLWDGLEDNVWLEQYLKGNADIDPTTLMKSLTLKYEDVLAVAGTPAKA